jgi:hypothetical protein
MATMEFKHKSVCATQQEARCIRSKVLADDGVVVLNLMNTDDVEIFLAANPNVDYRCQVLHECITCRIRLACYAVATSQVEFVLIVIVPPPIHHAYLSFTKLVRHKYLDCNLALINTTQRCNGCRVIGQMTSSGGTRRMTALFVAALVS